MSRMLPWKQGVAYYPDYSTNHGFHEANSDSVEKSLVDRIRCDYQRMRRCGISAVRIGEFSWASVQPEPGDSYDFSVLRSAIELAGQFNLDVWLCTPTACPPKWLVDQYPEILPKDSSGSTYHFGSRRHYDPTNNDFRVAARSIVHQYAANLGGYLQVVGWQIDNELGHHGTGNLFSDSARIEFQRWLKGRYESIDRLNESWFTCFWSQRFRNFEEIDVPRLTLADHNPHMQLDYRRFCTDVYAKFMGEQISIIRHSVPDARVTHNFNSSIYAYDLCPWVLAKDLSLAGFDHYQEDVDPSPNRSLVNFTLMRSLKCGSFTVLEQQPLQVNWQKVNKRFTYDWLFLWALQAVVLGAESVFYFSWQRFYGGVEMFHDGIVGHDVRIPQTKQEKVLTAIQEALCRLHEICGADSSPSVVAEVLVLHSTDSLWTHNICAQSTLYDPLREVERCCELLTSLGVGFEFQPELPKLERLKSYKAILIPGYAFEFTSSEIERLKEYLAIGGRVLSFPRTGMKKKDNHMVAKPLTLFDAQDFAFYDYGALGADEVVQVRLGRYECLAELWLEDLVVVNPNWISLGSFVEDMYDGPAAIRYDVAEGGSYTHLAFIPRITPEFRAWFSEYIGVPLLLGDCGDVHVVPTTRGVFFLNFSRCDAKMVDPLGRAGYLFNLSSDLSVSIKELSDCSCVPSRSILFVPQMME
jgi:beta-galactosidase